MKYLGFGLLIVAVIAIIRAIIKPKDDNSRTTYIKQRIDSASIISVNSNINDLIRNINA